MKTNAAILVVLLMIGADSSRLSAAEYHVAPVVQGASDENPGTLVRPWKTIAKGANTVRPGDTVFVHTGRYGESLAVRSSGTADKPITFQAFANDEVLLDGADPITAENWHVATNARNIYITPMPRDPGQVLMDGKAIYVKLDPVSRVYPRTYKRGILGDSDKNCYQYDSKTKELLLNLGGDAPARHAISVPIRATAFKLSAYCKLAGIHASHYVGTAIEASGDDALVEDCLVTDSGGGIRVSGWNRRGVIVRRNTVIGALGNGIFFQDRPKQCLVEDNLVIRCSLNPAHEVGWFAGIKMNSAAETVFAHNVVLEGGNPETDGGVDGPALWGDINIVRVMYLGNVCANNKEAGIYIEFAMDDTRAYFNTSYRDGYGITCRASQRGVFMRNIVLESHRGGLVFLAAEAPYDTTDNVFAHNLVRGCAPSIRFQTEQPAFSDYNTYWPSNSAPFAEGQAGKRYRDLADWIKATGHDAHSKIQDARPADIGLDTLTFRVAEAKDPAQVLTMVGNGGCEYEDPAGQDVLPYFWRPGSGDGVAHQFSYAVYCGLAGGVEAQAYVGAGATVSFPGDSTSDTKRPKLAHSGLRCLKIEGQKPAQMCAEGLGFWSPSLPARAGDVSEIGFFVRGEDLKPAGAAAICAFVEFTNATGQHRLRVALPAGVTANTPLTGSFDWIRLSAEVRVPADARRMRVFLGLAPAQGTLLLDDIRIKVL